MNESVSAMLGEFAEATAILDKRYSDSARRRYDVAKKALVDAFERIESRLRGFEQERDYTLKQLASPPPGWFTFGTHIEQPDVALEFWGDEGGVPIWERPAIHGTPILEEVRDHAASGTLSTLFPDTKSFDAWLAEYTQAVVEARADLADRWLSHALNFPVAFVDGNFFIQRNAAANLVPEAIRTGQAPPNEPARGQASTEGAPS